jgi:DNA-binding response OmpR family regulator
MAASPKKILVLDDEENYADMLQKLLQQHNFIVDSATRPEVALKALEDKSYGLVISDYKMPVMDGADFLLKAHQLQPDLPVILVSGLMNTPELVKVANMGVTLVLEKPLQVDAFVEQVSRFVAPLDSDAFDTYLGSGEAGADRKARRNYPPARHFSDGCLASQVFLQALWEVGERHRQVFLQVPDGAELALVGREMCGWKGLASGGALSFPARDLAVETTRERISKEAGKPPFVPVVLIHGIEELTAEELPVFLDFVNEGQFELPQSDNTTFVYCFRPSWLENPPLELGEDYVAFLAREAIRFPSFRDRAPDLARYAARALDEAAAKAGLRQKPAWGRDAVAWLLQHDWPGNHAELNERIEAALGTASDGVITAADLAGPNGPTAEALTDPSLRRALVHRQQAVLESVRARDAALFERLAASGETEAGDGTELLFPSLVSSP